MTYRSLAIALAIAATTLAGSASAKPKCPSHWFVYQKIWDDNTHWHCAMLEYSRDENCIISVKTRKTVSKLACS